jgi:hypothetical protein
MFTVHPLTPTTGAEIAGRDLASPCDSETFAALEQAWVLTIAGDRPQ